MTERNHRTRSAEYRRADARRTGPSPEVPVIDVLGIGFGPANLALAIAIREQNEEGGRPRLHADFLEKKLAFSWHPGMLIDGATMQVSFLKDLATLRNPTSRFSFIAYLHDKGRLIDFINHKCIFPSRIEFHDYLSWCAAQFPHQVRYGCEVVSGRPVMRGGNVTHYEVVTRDQRRDELVVTAARNLVIAPGLTPRIPAGVTLSRHVWHSHTLLDELADLPVARPRRFIVLGAGQSAAETVHYLHSSFADAEVCALFSRVGYSQAEDSPFVNRIFDPETVDVVHGAPGDVKTALMRYHANTNYSVVDVGLIEELYRRFYQEKVQGVSRLRVLNMSQLARVREHQGGVEVTVRHLPSGQLSTLEADALICATGYVPTNPLSLISGVGPLLASDDDGRLLVERDYRVSTGSDVIGGIYLCGGTEHSHGITSSLLSMAAVRAGEIARSIADRTGAFAGLSLAQTGEQAP
jgi:L-ornithine N5-oxygenase